MMPLPKPNFDENMLYSLPEIAKSLNLKYITIYKYIRRGHLNGIRLGNTWRVSGAELNRYLRGEKLP